MKLDGNVGRSEFKIILDINWNNKIAKIAIEFNIF